MWRPDPFSFGNILVITLSNIGDVVLTLPVIDSLMGNFPQADLNIMVSQQAKELFENNPGIKEVIAYDKRAALKEKLRLILRLRKKEYDLVLDLRNTFFPYLIGAPCHSSIFRHAPADISHMRERQLWKLKSTLDCELLAVRNQSIWVKPEDRQYIDRFLSERGVRDNDTLVAINPGARSHIKRWGKEEFRHLCERLICRRRVRVVIIGEKGDLPLAQELVAGLEMARLHSSSKLNPERSPEFVEGRGQRSEPIIASGETALTQLFALISRCSLLISNDTAPLHIASYIGIPVVAIFGPTNPDKYKPQGENDIVLRKELSCSPCERALCRFNNECMQLITPEEVFAAVDKLLLNEVESRETKNAE